MIQQINLRKFKCFEILKLPLTNLTLLSGSNASGKSSLLQILVLLHQSIRENEWATRLMLNGNILKLGTVSDVVNKIHGRRGFKVMLSDGHHEHSWAFSGERSEMSMSIDSVKSDKEKIDNPLDLYKLLPRRIALTPYEISRVLETLTYITAERIGPRDFYPLEDKGKIRTVGAVGEHAVSVLYSQSDQLISEALILKPEPPTLLRQVEARMRTFFPGCGIVVEPITRMNAVTLGIRTSEETDYHRPIHVGFGLTQILPILVAALSAKPHDLLLIENPEVHLHPAGQALMGAFLAQVANTGVQVILETHSDHVLNGIRRAVRNKLLPAEQTSLHFFRLPTPGLDQVVSPILDKQGNVDFWPEGFFDQFDKDINHFAGWGE